VTPHRTPTRPARRAKQAPRRLTVFIDGGSRGNPGPAAAGVVVTTADGAVLHEAGIYLGRATNNVAEYRGLLAGLEAAAAGGATEVEVISDSELLVRQMTGQYRVKNVGLAPLAEQARRLASRFTACAFRHVRREQNLRADRLVNQALDLRANVGGRG
jgi:probable phosphoglycerate mutase